MKPMLLAGATGLVGSAFLEQALQRDVPLVTVGRRATGRVDLEVITDFAETPTLPESNVALCALGTTIAAAGSRSAFRAVDHDAVLAFARAAQAVGVDHFITVSAVGASPHAMVFYSRVKGETEAALEALEFNRLDILQPGLLLGNRDESRPVEALLQRVDPVARLAMLGPLDKYAGITAQTVATAMIALTSMAAPGTYRHDNRAMRRRALSATA